ncbi:hypothetical protein [Roseovarius sp. E0-M6]|uniref:hypothetical protein n=1 Tax=Roseovarius sp. E0-M6 TaxID=3127118 RepID=UPI00300FA2A5
MRELCVVVARPGTGTERLAPAVAALARRGFELFAERVLDEVPNSVPSASVARSGSPVLICFDPLIEAEDPPGESFAHSSIDGAAFHLGATLGAAVGDLKIAVNSQHAVAIMDAVLTGEDRAVLRERIALRRTRMETREPVISTLSRHRHRAKVELVEWQGGMAVKKTFRATAGEAMANEIAFHDDIAPLSPVPARILHRTGTALYFEYIIQQPASPLLSVMSLPWLLPMSCVAELAEFAQLVTARGWDPLDLTPRDNVLIDARNGALRCIDFEFARRNPESLKPEQAAFLSGIRDDDSAATLFDIGMRQNPYSGKWRPFTGLDCHSFLHDPPWLQRAKRAGLHPVWLIGRALGSLQRRQAHKSRRASLLSALAL